VEDNSVSVLELETLKTLLRSHGLDGLDDDIGHWYFVNVPGNQFTTVEVHKCMSSLLIMCRSQINSVQRPCDIQVCLHSFVIVLYIVGSKWHSAVFCVIQICLVQYHAGAII
jgi:hypothetical protein